MLAQASSLEKKFGVRIETFRVCEHEWMIDDRVEALSDTNAGNKRVGEAEIVGSIKGALQWKA